MPAEIITDCTDGYQRAQVHWGRDKTVVVSTVRHPDKDHAAGSDECRNGHCGESSRHTWDGMFVTLDREGCNRMIRALRKARDQAYGQDA